MIHGDALHLPFEQSVFGTIISLNLLHCLNDMRAALLEMKRVLTSDGTAAMSTLVISPTRWSNRYLNRLAESGFLVPRSGDHLVSEFNALNMPVEIQIKGNLAIINYRLAEKMSPNLWGQ